MEDTYIKLFYWSISLFIISLALIKYADAYSISEKIVGLLFVVSIILFGFAFTMWQMDTNPSDIRDGEGCVRNQFDTRC